MTDNLSDQDQESAQEMVYPGESVQEMASPQMDVRLSLKFVPPMT